MEIITNNLRAYGKDVFGCTNNKKDIMISLLDKGEFYDIFMSQEDAQDFYEELGRKLKENKEDANSEKDLQEGNN